MRMGPGEAFGARHQFVDPRVVLHGAGTERIHAVIDGVVPGGKAGAVADGLYLADFGEAFDFLAHVLGAERFGGVHRGDIEFGELVGFLARGTALKKERFILGDVGGDLRDHACTSTGSAAGTLSFAAREYMSARRVVLGGRSSMQTGDSG